VAAVVTLFERALLGPSYELDSNSRFFRLSRVSLAVVRGAPKRTSTPARQHDRMFVGTGLLPEVGDYGWSPPPEEENGRRCQRSRSPY
jgi:hypothetical protein